MPSLLFLRLEVAIPKLYNLVKLGAARYNVKQETARESGDTSLRIESLPFADIPGQTALFVRYQENAPSLRRFYPNAVGSVSDLADRVPEALDSYGGDRSRLCNALVEINKRVGASEETFKNLDLLRESDSVAIVTGQQAGLFTGPLYTLYKALTVIKTAADLRARDVKAVPVFWVASEDHDFREVANTFALDSQGDLVEAVYASEPIVENLQVGHIEMDGSIRETVRGLVGSLPATEFTAGLSDLLNEASAEGAGYGDAFSRLLATLLEKYGIIIFDPLHPEIKRMAAPVYRQAIARSGEIVKRLRARDNELKEAGYHSQVLVEEDYFPLFLQSEDGARHPIRKTAEGELTVKDTGEKFTIEELAVLAENAPERFSPTVVLRPVVQDYLLPTLCYFGGGAEIAYFAQNSVVYETLGRPVTPVMHRQSFTIVPSRHKRTLEKYGLEFAGLFAGSETILKDIVDEYLNPKLAFTFADVEERVNTEMNRLDQELSHLDPTLAANLATRRRKIVYHIAALRKKTYNAQSRADEVVHRRIVSLFTALLPNGNLQERTLGIAAFLNQYGPYFINWVYDSIDLEDKGHRIIYL